MKTTLAPSTLESLRINSKKMKVPLETEYLKHDAMVHWMGDRKAEKIILYMHGKLILVTVVFIYDELCY